MSDGYGPTVPPSWASTRARLIYTADAAWEVVTCRVRQTGEVSRARRVEEGIPRDWKPRVPCFLDGLGMCIVAGDTPDRPWKRKRARHRLK